MSETLPDFKLKILVAEDNPVNQMVAQALLKKLGCSVIIVENGEAAVQKVAQESFDLVLMDCIMPVMDGMEATRTIRASGQSYDQIPIIAFTANVTDEDQQAFQQAGMDDFIDKPVTVDKMTGLLQRWSDKLNG
ncbi:response regulator [Endozoicomonas gorgoniicola]|uniref:Response regulator n=1 Tax=Endozoicomonas gorgoniicola TaxID=1234144 RepID=A0ABT3MZW6_9GAMM|nr:response regulator [Endozoicomonas gorgoniicola]MCW7554910.1 response regulator [Endozoicomonas gorgoniicola]